MRIEPSSIAREADCLWHLDKKPEAIDHFFGLLHLNPEDSLGVRYLLAAGLLEEGRDPELARLLKQYDEETADWQYNRALPDHTGFGDEREGIAQAMMATDAWFNTIGAMDWVLKNAMEVLIRSIYSPCPLTYT
ncbi:MAG: hypothetical protein ACYDGS_09870 [Thermoleophilia bacterium]